jgi:hypothetical protein
MRGIEKCVDGVWEQRMMARVLDLESKVDLGVKEGVEGL